MTEPTTDRRDELPADVLLRAATLSAEGPYRLPDDRDVGVHVGRQERIQILRDLEDEGLLDTVQGRVRAVFVATYGMWTDYVRIFSEQLMRAASGEEVRRLVQVAMKYVREYRNAYERFRHIRMLKLIDEAFSRACEHPNDFRGHLLKLINMSLFTGMCREAGVKPEVFIWDGSAVFHGADNMWLALQLLESMLSHAAGVTVTIPGDRQPLDTLTFDDLWDYFQAILRQFGERLLEANPALWSSSGHSTSVSRTAPGSCSEEVVLFDFTRSDAEDADYMVYAFIVLVRRTADGTVDTQIIWETDNNLDQLEGVLDPDESVPPFMARIGQLVGALEVPVDLSVATQQAFRRLWRNLQEDGRIPLSDLDFGAASAATDTDTGESTSSD